jgi:thiol-disulfide isomerase/thioredoxin
MERRSIRLFTMIIAILIIVISMYFAQKSNVPREEESGEFNKMPTFNLEDTQGNNVTEKVFEDYKLTVVSIWATECGPCYDELDALKVIYDEYKDKGVNIIGFVVDGKINKDTLLEVENQMNLKFKNLSMDEQFINEIGRYITGTPSVFFVDNKGNIVGKIHSGTRGKDEDVKIFRKEIDNIIED